LESCLRAEKQESPELHKKSEAFLAIADYEQNSLHIEQGQSGGSGM